jgi:hypothetical protein
MKKKNVKKKMMRLVRLDRATLRSGVAVLELATKVLSIGGSVSGTYHALPIAPQPHWVRKAGIFAAYEGVAQNLWDTLPPP